MSCVPLYMHTWTPVPSAPAHLRASAPCACTNAPCTSTLCNRMHGLDFRYCAPRCFRLGKKGQFMLRHVAASSREHSTTSIRHASPFSSGPCVVLGKWHMPNKCEDIYADACGRMLVAACSRMPRHRLPFHSLRTCMQLQKRPGAWGTGAEVCMGTRN